VPSGARETLEGSRHRSNQRDPIKTHDLIYLLKKSGLKPAEPFLEFIGKINAASIPVRYPEDLQTSLKDYPKSVAKEYLRQTQEIVQWLSQHPNLSK